MLSPVSGVPDARNTNPALELLAKRLAALALKRSGVALGLWGEPGIGKTHTAKSLLQSLPFRSLSQHATVALPDLLRSLPDADLPLWAERGLEKIGQGEHLEADAQADVLGAYLSALAPFVLYLEDLHEASPQRTEFAQKLAQMVSKLKGVGLILTSRTQPPEGFEVVRLEALTPQESQALLEQHIGAGLPMEARAWIYKRAAGNPLFTLEFFRHLSRQGYLWNDGEFWRWREPQGQTMPVTVEALIERFIQEAGRVEGVHRALEAKALLPLSAADAADDLWAKAAGLEADELQSAQTELASRGILMGDAFAHPLFREITLRDLHPRRRQEIARRAIAALQDRPESAVQFLGDASLSAEESLAYLRRAAQQAKDPLQAAHLTARMVEYLQGETQAEVALQAARGLYQTHVPEAYRLAELAATSPTYRSEGVLLMAEMLALQMRLAEAEQLLKGLALPLSEQIQKQIWLRGLSQNHGAVLEIVKAHPEVLHDPSPEVLHRTARAYAQFGNIGQAEALVERGLSMPKLSAQERAMLLRAAAFVAYRKGDYAQMEALEAEILDLAGQMHNLRLKDQALFNRALALAELGRYGEQKDSLLEAMQVCRELGDPTAYMIAQKSYALLVHKLGQPEQAEVLLLEAKEFLQRLEVSGYLVDCEHFLAELYLEWQPPHGRILALKYAHSALAHVRQLGNQPGLADSLVIASQAEAWAGNAQRALELAREAGEIFAKLKEVNAFSARAAEGYALKVLGDVSALSVLREAEQQALEQEALESAHKIGLEADHLEGNRSRALERLEWFRQKGLRYGEQLVRRLFPAPGQTVIQEASDWPRLEVLGSMRLSGEAVRGAKRQELLALLLEARIAGRAEASRLELLDALYPGEDEVKAASSLKELVRNLRSSLGAPSIATTASGYALGAITSDAEEFLKSGQVGLWRGPYLEGVGLPAVEESVQQPLYLALKAKLQEGQVSTKEAVRLGRILLTADPYDLEALRLTCQALRQSKNHKSLNRLYQEAREQMKEVGETLPEDWKAFLRITS